MWDTAGRLLHLLALLQRRQEWSADELGRQLSVTTRTVRRDIARLRELGYPVATIYGNGGGYYLEAGAALPPLMFDSDEAVSTVLALRTVASNASDESSSSLLSALDKLTRVMPPRLRATIAALSDHSNEVDLGTLIGSRQSDTDFKALITLSRASREERQVVCVYTSATSSEPRRIEPHHLVKTLGRWYLVAYCLDRSAWRTFRVERLSQFEITKLPIIRRTPPSDDLNSYVADSIRHGYRRATATVRIWAPKEQVEHWILPAWGTITKETETTSIAEVGAEDYDVVARWLLLTDAPITVIEPPALLAAFDRLAAHCQRIAEGGYSAGVPPMQTTASRATTEDKADDHG